MQFNTCTISLFLFHILNIHILNLQVHSLTQGVVIYFINSINYLGIAGYEELDYYYAKAPTGNIDSLGHGYTCKHYSKKQVKVWTVCMQDLLIPVFHFLIFLSSVVLICRHKTITTTVV